MLAAEIIIGIKKYVVGTMIYEQYRKTSALLQQLIPELSLSELFCVVFL
jgi:hypothetical protein